MNQEDQYVEIILPSGVHTAFGSPSLIYASLIAGDEVVCGEGDTEHVIRLSPGFPFALSYDESDPD